MVRDPYDGERNESGQRDGRGSYQWSSAFKYKGEWREGVMHGHGVMCVGSSTVEGEFTQGEINGVGVRTWLDEDDNAIKQYRGDFHKGEMSGHGEVTSVLERYIGSFVANRREGQGTLWTAAKAVPDLTKSWRKEVPGDRVEGTWAYNKMHGTGKLVQLSGHTYSGEFAGGWRTGTGLGTWAGGATYEGEWLRDLRHGKGSYRCLQSGLEYHGPWVNDTPTACARQLAVNFSQHAMEGKDGKRATQNKGKKKEDTIELLQLKPGDQLPPIIFKARTSVVESIREEGNDEPSIIEDGEVLSQSPPDPRATGESGRSVMLTVRQLSTEIEGESLEKSSIEDFFVLRPTISESSSDHTRFLENEPVPLLKENKSKKEEKLDFKGLSPSIVLTDPQDRVDSGWICQTAQLNCEGKPTDESMAGGPSKETRSFPPEMGCTISLDFCLDTAFGALDRERKEDDAIFKPEADSSEQEAAHRVASKIFPGQTQLLETFETEFPLTISIACEDEGWRVDGFTEQVQRRSEHPKDEFNLTKDGDKPFNYKVEVDRALHGGQKLVDAVLVIHLPDSERCYGATLEFCWPEFDPTKWHSFGLTMAPDLEKKDQSWLCIAACDGSVLSTRNIKSNSFRLRHLPSGEVTSCKKEKSEQVTPSENRVWGVRCKLGGDKFAGAFTNLLLSDVVMSNEHLTTLTSCFKNYYTGEAIAVVEQAKENADFELRWLVKEGKDEEEKVINDGSVGEEDPKIGRKSMTSDRKFNAGRESSASRKSVLTAPASDLTVPKLKVGAPNPPLHIPGATRINSRVAMLKEGQALVAGLKLSSRAQPGKYIIHIHDVSRDGFKRWSKAESKVFPSLPDTCIKFLVS